MTCRDQSTVKRFHRWSAGQCAAVLLIVLLCLGAVGCRSTSRMGQVFENPVRLGVVDDNYVQVLQRYKPFADQLNRDLDKPVVLQCELNPSALAMRISEDRYDVVLLDAVQYAEVSREVTLIPIATLVNDTTGDKTYGYFVTPHDSDIDKIERIAGKRIAFGPYGSPDVFYAAVWEMADHGVKPPDLGEVSYGPDNLAVARKLMFGHVDVGVVNAHWYQTSNDRWLPVVTEDLLGKPFLDLLVIVDRTAELPGMVLAVTEHHDPGLASALRRLVHDSYTPDASVKCFSAIDACGFVPADAAAYDAVTQQLDMHEELPTAPLLEF